MSTSSALGQCWLPGTPFLCKESGASALNGDWGGGELGCPRGGPGLNVYMFVFWYYIYICIQKKWYIVKKKRRKIFLVNFCAGWRMTLPASSCVPAPVPTTWEESGESALLGWGPLGRLQAEARRPPPTQEPIHGSSHISAWNKHSVISMRQVDTILASPYMLVPALFSWEESGASALLGLRARLGVGRGRESTSPT